MRRGFEKLWRANLHPVGGAQAARTTHGCLVGDFTQCHVSREHHDVHVRAGEGFIQAKLDRRGTKDRQWQIVARHVVMNSREERIEHTPGERVPVGQMGEGLHVAAAVNPLPRRSQPMAWSTSRSSTPGAAAI